MNIKLGCKLFAKVLGSNDFSRMKHNRDDPCRIRDFLEKIFQFVNSISLNLKK